MVTLEQLQVIDEQAADWVATLRASVDARPEAEQKQPAVEGMRGLAVGKLATAFKNGLRDKDEITDCRHRFVEVAFGIEGGSSNQFTQAQASALAYWLDDGGDGVVDKVVKAAILAAGQQRTDALLDAAQELGAEVRPEEETKMEKHWIEENGSESKFWQYVTGMGLTPVDVYEALGVEQIAQTDKSKAEVVDLLKSAQQGQRAALREKLQPAQEVAHSEAQAIAFMDVYTPDGVRMGVTAREGASAKTVAATTLTLMEAWDLLKELGCLSHPNQLSATARKPPQSTTPVPQPRVPVSAPAGTAPPSTPAAPSPPTAPRSPATPGGNGKTKGGTAALEKITVNADGQAQFHVEGFRWPFKDSRGGEVISKLFDTDLGWTPGHFTPGVKYEKEVTGLVVDWEKPGKYYDVVRVRLA